jgi:hypothetical protein
MDVGRFLSLSAVANNGVLALLAAVVVLLVLVWAISSPFWEIPDEPEAAPSAAGPRPGAMAADATSPLPRAIRAGAYAGPRHAAGPARPPKVSGTPPWEPAPRPRSAPPAGWLSPPRGGS